MKSDDLVRYLNDYLCVSDVPDWPDALNGLQVQGTREIQRVAVGVDACAYTIERAARWSADLLIVHHGLFWGPKRRIVDAMYARMAGLISSGIALYSSHTPLDAHPEVGNNHVLARGLGLTVSGRFGEVEGVPLGVWCDSEIERDDLVDRLRALLGSEGNAMLFGPTVCRRIGIISGGAGDWIARAQSAGCDTYITGEGQHHTFFEAEDLGLNVFYAGHYATETVGVKALALHLEQQFGFETTFIDHPTGL